MPTTYTSQLRLTLQDVGENPDTWGLILNSSVFELLEDAISGLVSVSVTASDATLTANNGASDQSRNMILRVTGNAGVARNVIVPSISKIYVAIDRANGTTPVTVKTATGTGALLIKDQPMLLFVDTNLDQVVPLANVATATLADNATLFDSLASSAFAQLDIANNFSKAQATTVFSLSDAATIAINATQSCRFRVVLGGNRTLGNPSGTLNGVDFSVQVVQDGTGGRTLAYASKYVWPGGSTPTITPTANRSDLITFSYDITSDKYLGSIIQNYAI